MGWGSLAGAGVDHHEAIKTTVERDGVRFEHNCDFCGKPIGLVAEWPELIIMSLKKIPGDGSWYHDPNSGRLFPNLRCGCQNPIKVGITPDECARHVNSGISQGKITVAQANTIAQQVSGAR